MALDLIFTKSRMLLSKTTKDWRLWQEEYDDYVANVLFEDIDDLLSYLQMDYRLSDLVIQRLSMEIIQTGDQITELKF